MTVREDREQTNKLELEDLAECLPDALAELVRPFPLILPIGVLGVAHVGAVDRAVDRGLGAGLVVLVSRRRTPLGGQVARRRIDHSHRHARWWIPRRGRRGLA